MRCASGGSCTCSRPEVESVGPDRQARAGRHDGEAGLDAFAERERRRPSPIGAEPHRAAADPAEHHPRLGDGRLGDLWPSASSLQVGPVQGDDVAGTVAHDADQRGVAGLASPSASGRGGTAGRRRRAQQARGRAGSAPPACRRSGTACSRMKAISRAGVALRRRAAAAAACRVGRAGATSPPFRRRGRTARGR